MRILTVEREYGCGAPIIAERLADELGWKLWDQSLTAEIAKIAKVAPEAARRCDERLDPWLYRLAKTFWRGSYERSLPLPDPGAFDTDCMVSMVRQVIEDAAKQGTLDDIVPNRHGCDFEPGHYLPPPSTTNNIGQSEKNFDKNWPLV